MDLQLRDKTALVTDASMGIGRATAKPITGTVVPVDGGLRRYQF